MFFKLFFQIIEINLFFFKQKKKLRELWNQLLDYIFQLLTEPWFKAKKKERNKLALSIRSLCLELKKYGFEFDIFIGDLMVVNSSMSGTNFKCLFIIFVSPRNISFIPWVWNRYSPNGIISKIINFPITVNPRNTLMMSQYTRTFHRHNLPHTNSQSSLINLVTGNRLIEKGNSYEKWTFIYLSFKIKFLTKYVTSLQSNVLVSIFWKNPLNIEDR